MLKSKKNKYGEELYPIRVSELDTNTRFTVWWTIAQCEFGDFLARTGGLCYVDGFGYFYSFEQLKSAMDKAFENPYWLKRLEKS